MSIVLDGTSGINTSGSLTTTGSVISGSTITSTSSLTTGTGAVYDGISRGTAITATTTTVEFTAIPSWVKRITLGFSSLVYAALPNITLGTGATPTYVTSGYLGTTMGLGASTNSTTISTGIPFTLGIYSSGTAHGQLVLTNISGNIWIFTLNIGLSSVGEWGITHGSIPLGAALTAVKLSAASAFTSGTVNILYE